MQQKKLKFNNKYNKGKITLLVVKEKGRYVGVCLEFDLVVRAATLKEAKRQIEDYAEVWHKNIVKNKLSEQLLNKPAPKKYWRIYEQAVREETQKVKAEKYDTFVSTFSPGPMILKYQTIYPGLAFG